MTTRLEKTIDQLDALIQQQRSSLGNPRVLDALNDLTEIHRAMQSGAGKNNIIQIRAYLQKIKNLL